MLVSTTIIPLVFRGRLVNIAETNNYSELDKTGPHKFKLVIYYPGASHHKCLRAKRGLGSIGRTRVTVNVSGRRLRTNLKAGFASAKRKSCAYKSPYCKAVSIYIRIEQN